MNIEKHRAFLDSLEGERGLPEKFYRLITPEVDVWKEGDEVYLTNYWSLCQFKTDRFIYKGEKEFVRIFHGAHGWTDLVKNEKVNYGPARRLIEYRQIPDLKEKVKEFGRFCHSIRSNCNFETCDCDGSKCADDEIRALCEPDKGGEVKS